MLTWATGFHRPFTLTDPSIAYPLKSDIISIAVVAVISLVGPAAIIAALNVGALFLRSRHPGFTWSKAIRATAWETHAGWLGLCAGLASTLFVTAGLKDMVGKPRPDLLARCDPDLANLAKYIVGGFGKTLESEATPLVTSAICRQTDRSVLNDGFAAFPSGHSSFSSAGMVYLTLWLCARWNVVLGYPTSFMTHSVTTNGQDNVPSVKEQRTNSAAPLWLTALAFSPIILILFICSSRYADFHHAGVDIIAGSLIGIVLGWSCFRLYHGPIRRAAGLQALNPRGDEQAFFGRAGQASDWDEEQGQHTASIELGQYDGRSDARATTGSSQDPIINRTTAS